jgi:hypothetical protein
MTATMRIAMTVMTNCAALKIHTFLASGFHVAAGEYGA